LLTKKAKYAIKALSFLAEQTELVSAREIAERAHIPRKFLEVILLELKTNGFVDSKQGISGGYFLTRGPQHIHLADLYRIFDGPIAPVPCVSLNFYEPCEDCMDEGNCAIRAAMIRVRDETIRILEGMTIAQIVAGYKYDDYFVI
jgi:Rrf2 family protein